MKSQRLQHVIDYEHLGGYVSRLVSVYLCRRLNPYGCIL